MELKAFVKLVKAMRTAQKHYFQNRLRSDLIVSKDLEGRIDFELQEFDRQEQAKPQGGLFDCTGSLFQMPPPAPADGGKDS